MNQWSAAIIRRLLPGINSGGIKPEPVLINVINIMSCEEDSRDPGKPGALRTLVPRATKRQGGVNDDAMRKPAGKG